MRRLVALITLCSFTWASTGLAFDNPVGRGGTIQRIVLHGLGNVSESSARGVIPMAVGEPYQPGSTEKAIALLTQWGRFRSIRTRIERKGADVIVHFIFTPTKRIGEIAIHGNYPMLEEKVRRQLSIRPGDVFDATDVTAQRERIKAFYERAGFFGTQVTTRSRWHAYVGEMRVHYDIKRGKRLRWGTLTVNGNSVLPPGRFRTAYPMWKYYNLHNIRKGLTQLAKMYHQLGYPKARVRLLKKTPDFSRGRMDLALTVVEGQKLHVLFKGNQAIPPHRLRRALTFFTEGRFDRYEIEASVKKLVELYADRGYPEAKISWVRGDRNAPEQHLVFHIVEGPKRTIWQVLFRGNQERGQASLRQQVLTRSLSISSRGTLNPQTLNEDMTALRSYYRDEGFLDAAVGPSEIALRADSRFFDVVVPVSEGVEYRVGSVTFTGNVHALHDDLLKVLQLQPKKSANLKELVTDRQAVALYCNDHGYPYVDVVQTHTKHAETGTVDITYHMTEGPPVTIGQIIISGDFLTSQRAILNAMKLKPGDPYSDREILESLVQLRRLGAFRNVSIERVGLAERRTTVHLAVHVEEERPFQLDVDLGYSTDDQVVGELRFTNLNSFGWAKRTQFLLAGGQERARGEITWIDPNFAFTDLLFTNSLFIDRKKYVAFDRIQAGGVVGLLRQYHRFGFQLRYLLTRNRILNGLTADLSSRDTTMSQVSASATFDTRNSFAQPTRGAYFFSQADLFNEIRGERADFVKLQGGASHYLHLGKGIVLSNYGRLGGIQSIGFANIPITERFFAGGDDTIRGFPEDRIGTVDANGSPVGGNVRWLYNTELSAPLGDSLRAVTFFDVGSLTNSFAEINTTTVRESIGFGLRYNTPIGPIRADYGFKLDQQPGESNSRLHFTFGHLF